MDGTKEQKEQAEGFLLSYQKRFGKQALQSAQIAVSGGALSPLGEEIPNSRIQNTPAPTDDLDEKIARLQKKCEEIISKRPSGPHSPEGAGAAGAAHLGGQGGVPGAGAQPPPCAATAAPSPCEGPHSAGRAKGASPKWPPGTCGTSAVPGAVLLPDPWGAMHGPRFWECEFLENHGDMRACKIKLNKIESIFWGSFFGQLRFRTYSTRFHTYIDEGQEYLGIRIEVVTNLPGVPLLEDRHIMFLPLPKNVHLVDGDIEGFFVSQCLALKADREEASARLAR